MSNSAEYIIFIEPLTCTTTPAATGVVAAATAAAMAAARELPAVTASLNASSAAAAEEGLMEALSEPDTVVELPLPGKYHALLLNDGGACG
jgi:hypothetical protein